jgi:hypothetical protein
VGGGLPALTIARLSRRVDPPGATADAGGSLRRRCGATFDTGTAQFRSGRARSLSARSAKLVTIAPAWAWA